MYEIIANPEDYQIDHLINGTDNANIELTRDERDKWAGEIINFSEKLTEFAKKSEELAKLLKSNEKISATQASLKTLKIQLFAINDALNSALTIADRLESDIVHK
jgi:septal ring factor EnvC (AmiA/AmiB activator)